MSSDKQKQIGDYLLKEEIGSGGFAKVVLGTHIPTGEKVAIKIMDKEQILSDELNKERVLNEIKILKIVRHNNIIKLYEVMETPQNIYLVMEYCDGGELFDYIVSKQHLSEKQACVFFQEIIDALTYLHSQNIVHRDVKPENILLESFGKTMTCKLIDFGISRTYTLDKLISTPCGTASYAPPEMHRGEEYYGLLSDVWSAGVLLYAMVFGYLPFCEEAEDTNIDNIIKGNYEIPEEASPLLSDFLSHILDIDPLTRYDFDQIKSHPWYNIVTPQKALPGLIIGYHKIPIDERILNVSEAYGFDKNEVRKSVQENKYDNKSSIYYIILNKMKKEGYDSIADLFSKDYIEYINNPSNLIKKEDKKKDKKEDKKDDNDDKKEEKNQELPLLDDALKPKEENKKDITDKQLINPELEQISTDNKLKLNKSDAEISVASENSKKENDIRNESHESSSERNNNKDENKNSSPKISNNENNDISITPKKINNENSYSSAPKRKNSEISNNNAEQKNNEANCSPKKKEEINNSLKEIHNKEYENESNNKEEIKPSEALATLDKKIMKEPNLDVNKEEGNKNINIYNEVIPQKPIIEVQKEEIGIKQSETNTNIGQPVTVMIEKEENPENNEIPKEKENNSNINPTLDKIIENIEEIQKLDKESEQEKEIYMDVDIKLSIQKEQENIPSIPISVKNEIELEKINEPLITLAEQINPEKEKITEGKVENKNKQDKKINDENKNEIKIEQVSKTINKMKPEISISNRPQVPKLSYSLMPKHSFLINSNTKKILSFNIEDDDNNKLNTSFTMKLNDSLKENILKLKNPKMKNPNKEKEINKALYEIKHKKGASNIEKKKENIPKPKNKKNMKISNEPLFKDNKRKEHTIIHNRNASVASGDRKNNKEEEKMGKNRNKKDVSSSLPKIERKNINNPNNIDLKNNMKKIKDSNENKEKINENNDKKRNINLIKKNIPKPAPSLNKKNNIYTDNALNATSNKKLQRKNVSAQKKVELKTPNKNLDKTHFEKMYHNLDNSNINKDDNPNTYLNKTIQLNDVKKTNKKLKIPYDKNNYKKYKNNIRISAKNIEEEDIITNDKNKKSEINYKNKNKKQINIIFNSNSTKDLSLQIKNKDEDNSNVKKRKLNHNQSNPNYNNSREYIFTENNDNALSHNNLNNYQRKSPKHQEGNIKNNRYQSVVKTERSKSKIKKFLDLSTYDLTNTEIANRKKGNWKFLNNNKIGKKQNTYYNGPIDIRNLVIGNSMKEINEKINFILYNKRVKCWKLNPCKFYCNKNGEIFVVEIFLLSNKIIINNNKDKEDKKEENKEELNEVNEFDRHSKCGSIDTNYKDNKNNKTKKLFYIKVLSKDSSNVMQAKNINKIINKKCKEMKNK